MEIQVFVDASTVPNNPGDVGVAFSALVDGRQIMSWAGGGRGTSNYGEILAMAFALEVLKPSPSDGILIVTDSLYALKVVTKAWPAGVNSQVAAAVGTLSLGLRGLQFDLVAGHEGIPGNAMADFLAHQAGIRGRLDPAVPLYVPPAPGLHDIRVLEFHIMPRLHELKDPLRERVFRVHRAVRAGVRTMNATWTQLIREARTALGMEGAIS